MLFQAGITGSPGRRGLLLVAVLSILTTLWGAGASAADMPPDAAITQSLRKALQGPKGPVRLHLSVAPQLAHFYDARDFRPVWVSAGGPLPRAATLLDALRHADAEGLRPGRFRIGAIRRRLQAHSPAGLADLDLLLSDAWCRYAVALKAGSTRLRKADRHWHIIRKPVDPAALLQQALAGGSFRAALHKLAPPHAAYRHLRKALAHYRGIAAQGGWPALPKGPSIKPGMSDPRIPLLRRRLRISGDLSAHAHSTGKTLDPVLEQAVKRYQRRNGLDVDGIVGRKTRAALNVPVSKRIQQIRVNMERWRWLPGRFGARYIMVNSAGFDLHVFEHGKAVMTMKAIIGRASRQTPSLHSAIDAVVINPYWYVPAKLARLDLLPKEQADPRYFREHGIKVFSGRGPKAVEINPATVDWDRLSARHFPYRLRQDPGPGNALGRVKLLFPNPYDVYLHDTPHRDLFECSVRTFSSGCVRLEHAVRLAAYVLHGTDDWDEARLRQAIKAQATRKVRVADPVPLYLVYLTAWADADGTMHFRDDVYRRDRALLRAGL